MATTIGNFTAINDAEVDAESPITESLMTRLRDNAYWVNAGTQKTSETTANKVLETAGSGVLQWTLSSSFGVNGTKGVAGVSVTPATSVAIQTNRYLLIYAQGASSTYPPMAIIDASDDTFVGIGEDSSGGGHTVSGTITGSNSLILPSGSTGSTHGIQVLKSGSDYDFSQTASSKADAILYIWL
jgi:hypothetical protein